jgi:hypothetical protein
MNGPSQPRDASGPHRTGVVDQLIDDAAPPRLTSSASLELTTSRRAARRGVMDGCVQPVVSLVDRPGDRRLSSRRAAGGSAFATPSHRHPPAGARRPRHAVASGRRKTSRLERRIADQRRVAREKLAIMSE